MSSLLRVAEFAGATLLEPFKFFTLAHVADIGRVFRYIENTWRPISEPLPPFAHAAPDPSRMVAPWVLPRDVKAQAGDVVAWHEVAFRLVGRCADDSPEVQSLATQTLALHDATEVQRWLQEVEVWLGMRMEPGRTWPEPPASDGG